MKSDADGLDNINQLQSLTVWMKMNSRLTWASSTGYFGFCVYVDISGLDLFLLMCRRDLSDRPRLASQHAQTKHATLSTVSFIRQVRIIFSYCASKQWDSLPSDIRHIKSSNAFKTALKTHLKKNKK